MRFLCVGGPKDGQVVDVDPRLDIVQFPVVGDSFRVELYRPTRYFCTLLLHAAAEPKLGEEALNARLLDNRLDKARAYDELERVVHELADVARYAAPEALLVRIRRLVYKAVRIGLSIEQKGNAQ